MALAVSPPLSEIQVLHQALKAVPEIEAAWAQTDAAYLRAIIAIAHHEQSVEHRLSEIEGHIIDNFPWLDVDFDVVILNGRDVNDVVSPKRGSLLFAR